MALAAWSQATSNMDHNYAVEVFAATTTGDFCSDMAAIARQQQEQQQDRQQWTDSRHKQGREYLETCIKVYQQRIEQAQAELRGHQFSQFDSRFNRRSAESVHREIEQLVAEQKTFSLLHFLHDSRKEETAEPVTGQLSERDRVKYMRSDQKLRRFRAVVTWLEDSADTQNIQHSNASAEYRRTFHAMGKVPDLVEHLDPDVLFRHPNKHMHKEDLTDEAKLVNYVWKYVRAGRMDEAADLCTTYKQAWRAATLKGGKLWHDDQQEGSQVEGNRRRLLWKLTCRKLAEASPMPAEQAIYAMLGGDVGRVLMSGYCQSWEDCCWAYFKTMVSLLEDEWLIDSSPRGGLDDASTQRKYMFHSNLQSELGCDEPVISTELESLRQERRELLPTPRQHGVAKSAEEIFAQLERRFPSQSQSQAQNLGSNERYLQVQKLLILCQDEILPRDLRALSPFLQLDQDKPIDDHKLLDEPSYTAFAVHVCIYFLNFTEYGDRNRIRGDETVWDDRLMLFKFHIIFLIHKKQYDAALVYCKFLPEQMRIEQFGNFLRGLEEPLREEYLEKARQEFPDGDVVKITAFLVQNALKGAATSFPQRALLYQQQQQQSSQQSSADDLSAASKRDFVRNYLSASLESADQGAMSDAFAKANALFRHFMFFDKVDEAKKLRQALRDLTIGKVDEDTNWGREYQCWARYIDCSYQLQTVSEASGACVKPRAVPQRSAQDGLLKTPSDMMREREEAAEYARVQEEYQMACAYRADRMQDAFAFIHKTLTYRGGWLVDLDTVVTDPTRTEELNTLRRKCIPALINVLLRCCELCEDIGYINELACLVVQEPTDLYRCFSQDELKAILARFRGAHLGL